jgi:hypothetical protein
LSRTGSFVKTAIATQHTQQCEQDGNPSPLYRDWPHEVGSAMSLRARRVRMNGRSISRRALSTKKRNTPYFPEPAKLSTGARLSLELLRWLKTTNRTAIPRSLSSESNYRFALEVF